MELSSGPSIASPLGQTSDQDRKGNSLIEYAFNAASFASGSARVQSELRLVRGWIDEVVDRALYCIVEKGNTISDNPEKSDTESTAEPVSIHRAGRFNTIRLPCTIHL